MSWAAVRSPMKRSRASTPRSSIRAEQRYVRGDNSGRWALMALWGINEGRWPLREDVGRERLAVGVNSGQ